jgi:hypothetical protein
LLACRNPGNLTAFVQADHPLSLYNAAVLKVAGESAPVDCAAACTLFARLARRLHLPQLVLAKNAAARGDYQRALWHYMVANEGGIHLGAVNGVWLISRRCGAFLVHLGVRGSRARRWLRSRSV